MTISDDGLADDVSRDDLADAATRDDIADDVDRDTRVSDDAPVDEPDRHRSGEPPVDEPGRPRSGEPPVDEPGRPRSGERTPGQDLPALASRRRRAVVAELRTADGPLDVRTLANRVAAREYDPTAESTAFQQRQRVFVSLERTHLPALDEAAIVGYDDARGTVEPGSSLWTASGGASNSQEPAGAASPRGDDSGREPVTDDSGREPVTDDSRAEKLDDEPPLTPPAARSR